MVQINLAKIESREVFDHMLQLCVHLSKNLMLGALLRQDTMVLAKITCELGCVDHTSEEMSLCENLERIRVPIQCH